MMARRAPRCLRAHGATNQARSAWVKGHNEHASRPVSIVPNTHAAMGRMDPAPDAWARAEHTVHLGEERNGP